MAKENSGRKTFYLYDYSNNLSMKSKKIYSPYNVKTLWRTKSEDYFNDPDSVEFKNWQYIADRELLWDVRYEQQLEWLSFYNPVWWKLAKWKPELWQWHLNWRWIRNDWIHIVHMEEIKTWNETKIETVEKIVEKQQIPLIIAEWMDVQQLKWLAKAWNLEIQEDLLVWDSGNMKNVILKIMKESWNIS